MSKKVFESILVSLYQAIKKECLPVYGVKALRCNKLTADHFTEFHGFVQRTTDQIRAKTFRPSKYTDPRGTRRFTMVPIYTFQLRHVQLDANSWTSLLRKAGLFRGAQLKQEQLSEILWRQFDFSKIGIHNEEQLKTPRREFW